MLREGAMAAPAAPIGGVKRGRVAMVMCVAGSEVSGDVEYV